MTNKRKRPMPIAPPPSMQSRRKARIITTLFHKYTHELDTAIKNNDTTKVQTLQKQIDDIGGRVEYQRASALNTKLHSTSKWVLGALGKRGWLDGIAVESSDDEIGEAKKNTKKRKRNERRDVMLLEIGAINTQLLDAASRSRKVYRKTKQDASSHSSSADSETIDIEPVYKLDVRAIDLHSTHKSIEEADFLSLPYLHSDEKLRYDAVVCSMVINCVPNPEDRGKMLFLLYKHLRPGGLCFLTLPKLCLVQSRFISIKIFREMLSAAGFIVEEARESPKIAFFVLVKPTVGEKNDITQKWNEKWSKVHVIHKGKKYRNKFAIVLKKEYMEE